MILAYENSDMGPRKWGERQMKASEGEGRERKGKKHCEQKKMLCQRIFLGILGQVK